MRVATPTSTKYVPDVFFKYKNSYNIMVQEAAKPTFPVEYLLVTVNTSILILRVHMGSHNRLLQPFQRLLDLLRIEEILLAPFKV